MKTQIIDEDQYQLVGYELVKEDVIRDEPDGDIVDWRQTVIAESKTLNGLLRFAKMKKLETEHCEYSYFIESNELRYMPNYGGWVPDSGNIYPRKSLEELI